MYRIFPYFTVFKRFISMAKFTQGNAGKPKGAKNRVTEKVRKSFEKLLSDNLGKLQEDIDTLNAKDRIEVLLKLSEFVLPKLQRTEYIEKEQESDTEPRVMIYLPDNGRDPELTRTLQERENGSISTKEYMKFKSSEVN